jgi:hypothetical protein
MKRSGILYSFMLIVFLTANLSAQSNAVIRRQAVSSELNKDWYAAAQYYQRLCENDSTNTGWLYSYADASRRIFDVDVALKSFLKLAALDNGRKYPLTFFYIGELLKNKAQYKAAQQWFVKFSKLKVNERRNTKYAISYYKSRAKLEQEACELALINLKFPVLPPPERLDATVNTKQSEYAAFERDSVLYFSTARGSDRRAKDEEEARSEAAKTAFSKIYKSEIRKDKYKKIKLLDTTINSAVYHVANTSFSEDGKLMIFSRCQPLNASDNTCELFQSTLSKTKWSIATKLDAPVNQPSVSTTQPYLTKIADKAVLFFVSNRAGGQGGLDIWYCYRIGNNAFTEPVNAGPAVNTPEDEVSPWFDPKSSTLFFSTAYHKGFGGLDIFKSLYKDGKFETPVNAGTPINSPHNDLYYSQNEAGNHIYLSSNRTGSMFDGRVNCCSDIYRFTIDTTVVRPVPIDSSALVKEKIKLLVPLTLYFHNDEPEPKTTVTVTTKSYDSTYAAYARLKPKYLEEYSVNLKGAEKQKAIDLIENFFTDSLEGGLDQLSRFSVLLKQVLEKGETVKITMKGYCSPLASTNYNVNLAKRRISSLRNYFMQMEGGQFAKYINNANPNEGKIIFEDVDIGELPVSRASDNFKDKRNSVYSPFAAGERKIQIIAISFGAR